MSELAWEGLILWAGMGRGTAGFADDVKDVQMMAEDMVVCWYAAAERGDGGVEGRVEVDVVDMETWVGVIGPVDVAPMGYWAIEKQGKKERKRKAMVREEDAKVDSDQRVEQTG